MRRWFVRLLIAAVFLTVFAWLLRSTVFRAETITVAVAVVERGVVEETVTNSRAGTVVARRRAKLSPELGGTVIELPFREGDRVRAGEVVLRLDDSLQRARLAVADSELAAATARVEQPCLEAERAQRERIRIGGLVEDGIVSDDRLDAVESAAAIASAACHAVRSAVDSARAAVELARAELAKTVLRAPFEGLVAELSTELGEYSTPSPPAVPVPPALDLLDPESLFVLAPMDEVDSARLEPGQPVRVTVDSHRGVELPGRVVRVAPYVLDREEQNRTVDLEAELDDPASARRLLPGTSADVEVILERREDALRLPTSALLDGDRVLLFESTGDIGDDGEIRGTLREVEVVAGLRNWQWVELRSGLDAGQRVVVTLDRPEIRDGADVVLQAEDR